MRTVLQEALDISEVCLQALGRPVIPIKYAVDFGSLPFVPIPSSEPAQAAPGSSGTDDSGPADEAPPSADEADDTAPEELGDSTREAQNRGEIRLCIIFLGCSPMPCCCLQQDIIHWALHVISARVSWSASVVFVQVKLMGTA